MTKLHFGKDWSTVKKIKEEVLPRVTRCGTYRMPKLEETNKTKISKKSIKK